MRIPVLQALFPVLASILFTADQAAAHPWLCTIGMLLYVQSKGDSGLPRAGVSNLGDQSSVVHLECKLDFTLVILTVAYRSDFSEVSRVEEIKCSRGGYYAVARKPRE